jgi:hypothetical protein
MSAAIEELGAEPMHYSSPDVTGCSPLDATQFVVKEHVGLLKLSDTNGTVGCGA